MTPARQAAAGRHVAMVLTIGLLQATVPLNVAQAQNRPNTQDYTCKALKELVDRRKTIVMTTGDRNRFRRLNSRTVACPAGENFTPVSVPTRTGSCRLQFCTAPSKTN